MLRYFKIKLTQKLSIINWIVERTELNGTKLITE